MTMKKLNWRGLGLDSNTLNRKLYNAQKLFSSKKEDLEIESEIGREHLVKGISASLYSSLRYSWFNDALDSVEEIDLSNNNIEWMGIVNWPKNIKKINLRNNKITTEDYTLYDNNHMIICNDFLSGPTPYYCLTPNISTGGCCCEKFFADNELQLLKDPNLPEGLLELDLRDNPIEDYKAINFPKGLKKLEIDKHDKKLN